jgi:VanZ family protein
MIFCFSAENAEKSTQTSAGVIEDVLDAVLPEDEVTPELVNKLQFPFRKMAHFGEFFILSLEINLLIITIKKYQIKRVWVQLLIGLAVAIVDELLQLLVGRGAMVKDVLIDFGGVVSITLIILIIYLIVKKRQGRKI